MSEFQASNWDKMEMKFHILSWQEGNGSSLWKGCTQTMLLPLIPWHRQPSALRALVSIYFLEFWEMSAEFNTHDAGR